MAPTQRTSPATERLIAERIGQAFAAYEADRASGSAGTNRTGPPQEPRGCTYKDFLGCKPSNFTGTEGAVGLLQWFEKMEAVFRISNCPEENKVKYSTCTLSGKALTWWNSRARTLGTEAAYALSWEDLKHMMTNEYCPHNEVQKLEAEFWDLKVINNDVTKYTDRFLELSNLCPSMVTSEFQQVKRYIWGLTQPVQGLVTTSEPDTIQKAIHLAQELNDQYLRHLKTTENNTNDGKRKQNDYDNSSTSYQIKRQASGKSTRKVGKTSYAGTKPWCSKCNHYHTGTCASMCVVCKKSELASGSQDIPRVTLGNCFNCGQPGHHIRDCPKPRKNRPTHGK